MAATAGRSLLLLLLSRTPGGGGGAAALTAAGCFPALGRHRQQPPRHRTVSHQRLLPWQSMRVVYCSTVVPSDDVTVVYQNGLPVISVNLPSRRERCQFTLKPISDSVGVFLRQLQAEDRGIDRVAIYSPDGTRVASSTGIDLLLLDDFKLVINDLTYHVRPPKRDLLSQEDATTLNDVKTLVQQLYTTLCIEEHQLNKEKELIGRLEDLKQQLAPLEKVGTSISLSYIQVCSNKLEWKSAENQKRGPPGCCGVGWLTWLLSLGFWPDSLGGSTLGTLWSLLPTSSRTVVPWQCMHTS
ncbi:calcium uniporter protein, mitochondrial isoform X4 [Heteronotia binoei]|uniref:calcium uniporter protein, mitochondrial isoform X4 n=1 Tax=Heteronotia binoei TaxID=13085 RepID=UPI00292DAA70|nr:calcium uniporter protein, mitochondrial isoform X4 [Heteronotia binoei]